MFIAERNMAEAMMSSVVGWREHRDVWPSLRSPKPYHQFTPPQTQWTSASVSSHKLSKHGRSAERWTVGPSPPPDDRRRLDGGNSTCQRQLSSRCM